MSSLQKWKDAAEAIKEGASEHENRLVIAKICDHISETSMANKFDVDLSRLPNKIFLSKSDGSLPSKRLKFESITEDRVEICFSDSSAQTVRYYFPHTPSSQAFSRAVDILSNLNWQSEAKQYRNFIERVTHIFGGSTPNN